MFKKTIATCGLATVLASMASVPSAGAEETTPPPLRIAASRTSITDSTGAVWASDRYFTGGKLATTAATISGTADPVLYQRERYGMSSYDIPVRNGEYRVVLRGSENTYDAPGKRVFDVTAEGRAVATGVDWFALAGGKFRATMTQFEVVVEDGTLNVGFTRRLGAPKLSAIAITPTAGSLAPASTRLFGSAGPWNAPLPSAPALDAKSAVITGYLSNSVHPAVADLYEFGVPIWDADATTPRYSVDCVRPWGVCGLEKQPVPVPDNAFATKVTDDGAMVVVDWSSRTSYEFFEGQKLNGTWQAGWGGPVSIDGDGTGGSATGSNVSRLAGVIRASEIAAGRIDHALVFSTNNACATVYRYPATKTDGRSTRADCIPEGARIQLDPTIDVDLLPGITKGERAVAKALQTYGAYNIDNGGANMAFIFEVPSGEPDPYKGAGLAWDYFAMDSIPWKRLRVLREWNGA